MESGTINRQTGGSLIGASSNTFGIENPSGRTYTADEKHAALGRHRVSMLNISTSYLAGAGAIGGLAGAVLGGIARAVGDYSLKAVAWAGAAGATLGVVGTFANARQMTALEHAEYELEQAKADKAYLLKNQLDKPDHQCSRNDVFVIKYMAEKYQESWRSAWLLWATHHYPSVKNNQKALLAEWCKIHTGFEANQKYIHSVIAKMGKINTVEAAKESIEAIKELPDFKRLATAGTIRMDVHTLATTLCSIKAMIAKNPSDVAPGLSVGELYRGVCKLRYSQYKERLQQDINNLEEDVRILRSLPAKPATVSTHFRANSSSGS